MDLVYHFDPKKLVTWMSHADHSCRLLTWMQAVYSICNKLVSKFNLELFILTMPLDCLYRCKLSIHFATSLFQVLSLCGNKWTACIHVSSPVAWSI